MKKSGFRGKPTPTHIIWVRGQSRKNVKEKKRFDHDHFRKWAKHLGLDFETATRVDHDRGEEPRKQYRCVFKWGKMESETIELGDEEWSMGKQKTPRTFIEIDEAAWARVKGWTFEEYFDVIEMKHKGPELLIRTADGEKKRLNGRKFVKHPRKRQREDN